MPATSIDRIDGLTTSVAVKAPVAAVATTQITLTGEQTIGVIDVADGDRVLVMGQDDAVENGIYVASTGIWERALDFDGNRDVVQGTLVYNRYGGGYRCSSANPIVIGTSEIEFVQFGTAENTIMVNVFDHGAVGDGVTNDSVAVNLAAAAVKAQIKGIVGDAQYTDAAAALGRGVCNAYLYFPPGYTFRLESPIDLQNIIALGWGIEAFGSTIYGACAGKAVFDCLGSSYGRFRFQMIGASGAKPAIGLQIGRMTVDSTSAGSHLIDVVMDGFFTRAGIFNSSGEGNLYNNCIIHNNDATGNAHAIMTDGAHHFAPITDFEQSGWAADQADSCIQHTAINCDFRIVAGQPIYFANSSQIRFQGYAVATAGAAIDFVFGASQDTFRDLYFDIHVEGAATTNMIIFSANSALSQANVEMLYLRDFAAASSQSIIKKGTNITTLSIVSGEVWYQASYGGTLTNGTTVYGANFDVNGIAQKDGTFSMILLDDHASSFTMPGRLTTANVEVHCDGGAAYSGFIWVRANASPVCGSIVAGASVAVATGVLAGTTGTDGKLTVSPHTDGKVYIENRIGATAVVTVRLTGL